MITLQQCASLIQSGKADVAIESLKQIIALNVKDAEAHHLAGVAYTMLGDYKLAEKHLLRALKLNPQHLDAEYNLARLHTEIKKFSKAKQGLVKVLKQRPEWLQARFALGLAAVALKDTILALASFEYVVDKHPENFEAWCNIGNIYFEKKLYIEAKKYYKQALGCNSAYEDALMGLYRSMSELDELDDIVNLLLEYRDYIPKAEIDVELAQTYRLLGDKEKAKDFAECAFKKDPKNGVAYRVYYDSIKITDKSELVDLEQVLLEDDLSDLSRKEIHFALSKGMESCSEYELAIQHLNAANALVRADTPYKTADTSSKFNMLKKTYSQSNLASLVGYSELGEGLVFILGMPRSGTSLVEQIVSSHSNVHGAGELSFIGKMWEKLGSNTEYKYHSGLIKSPQSKIDEYAQAYLEQIKTIQYEETVLTDKMPHNFQFIGLISVLFPKAKIIHCKRNPIANCLSIYKANFNVSHGYAFSQKELAEYHNLYEDLMEHWRQVLPGKFYEIKYEDLTTNQEEETRKLIEYCGLEWEDACLDFHKNKRAVKTASAYQVRQKMHNKSIDLWKRYGDGLKPLIDNLYIPKEYRDQ